MSLLRVSVTFGTWFLRSPGAFSIRPQVHPLRQIEQRRRQFRGAHASKDVPLLLGDRDHHAVVRRGHFGGQLVEGYLIIDLLLAMHAS